MFLRSAEKYLNTWYQKSHRKPQILRGARQVGKSTLVRQFALKNNLILNEINLEQHLYLIEELPRILDEIRIEELK